MAFIQSAGAIFRLSDDSSPTNLVQVGEIVSIGEFGKTYNRGTFNPLSDRRTRKFKGAFDEGSFTIEVAYDPADSGQDAVETALDSDDDFDAQVELGDQPSGGSNGTQFDFTCKILSFTRNIGTTEDFVRASIQVEITSAITETAAA